MDATVTEPEAPPSLATLREEIDRIDRDLHAGLIARGANARPQLPGVAAGPVCQGTLRRLRG